MTDHRAARFVIHTLAVHRLVQLWTTDRILTKVRAAIVLGLYSNTVSDDEWQNLAEMSPEDVDEFARMDDGRPFYAELLYCWWCIGWWVSLVWWLIVGRARGRGLIAKALATSTGIVIVHDAIARLAPPDK